MPFEWKYTHDGAGVVMTAKDTISADDIFQFLTEVFSPDDDLPRKRFILCDYSHSTDSSITFEEVRLIAKNTNEYSKTNPEIVVASSAPEPLLFGLTRIWEVMVEGSTWTTFVTQSLSEALDWIRNETGLDVSEQDL